jgi:hypothetical protein
MRTPSQSASRIEALWHRLIGLYGADAVRRKFGDSPPPEWRDAVAQIGDAELQRGLRRLVHGGKAYVPSLPELIKACRTVGQDLESGEGKPYYALPAPEPAITDPWGATANRHLLAWVLSNNRIFRPTSGNDVAHITAIAVHWKNKWAETMRISTEDERQDGGKALWRNCMAQAEREISEAARIAA